LKLRARIQLLNRATIIVVLVLIVLVIGTIGFRLIEGWSWFTAFYAAVMTLATMGVGPLNRLSPRGELVHLVTIFLSVGAIGIAVGLFTQMVLEFELGSFFGRRRMEKEVNRLQDHFIICGAGRVGRHIAMEVSTRKLACVVIEKDSERGQWVQAQGIPLIVGDASSEKVLREAHIEHARGLASAVTSDAQNVYIVLTARGLSPDLPIIARASEDDAESKLRRAGATSVISPYHYAGQSMARMLTRPHVQRFIDLVFSPFNVAGMDLQIEEVCVRKSSPLTGTRLAESEIRSRLGIIILAIRHQSGQLEFNPGPEQAIAEGDFLIAMGDSQKLKELESLAGLA